MYVKNVEDRSNTPKGCNAMYVKVVEDGKRTYRHTFIIPFLIWYHLNVILCMSKMSKMGKEHAHTFWLITSLILDGFSIRKKFWKAETESFSTIQILCMLKHVEDVEDNLRHLRHALIYTVFDGMVEIIQVTFRKSSTSLIQRLKKKIE